MIQRAKFQNFKSLRDVEITFDSRLTVLVGPNGSGKTSVLEGLRFGLGFGSRTFGTQYTLSQLTRFASTWASWEQMRLDIEGNSPIGDYQISLQTPDESKWAVRVNASTELGQKGFSVQSRRKEEGVGGVELHGGWQEDYDAIYATTDRGALFRLSPNKLAKPTLTSIKDDPPLVGEDGSGLVSALSHLQKKHPTAFAAILESYRQVIPEVRDIRFDEAPDHDTGYFAPIVLVDFKHANGGSGLFALKA